MAMVIIHLLEMIHVDHGQGITAPPLRRNSFIVRRAGSPVSSSLKAILKLLSIKAIVRRKVATPPPPESKILRPPETGNSLSQSLTKTGFKGLNILAEANK
jgi:hypothetical protein